MSKREKIINHTAGHANIYIVAQKDRLTWQTNNINQSCKRF